MIVYLWSCYHYFHNKTIVIHEVVTDNKITVQNDKTFFLPCSISPKTYIIWLPFVVHKCKIRISSGVFFYFFKFLIFWIRSIKVWKMVQNDKKLCCACCALYLRNHISFDLHLWYTWVKGLGVKGQRMAQNDKKLCLSHSISQVANIMW